MKAYWNDALIAESNDTVIIEGNHYFPPESINKEYFDETDTHSVCPWKGTASYYSLKVGDEINKDAAWSYPQAKDLAKNIEGYYAFWKGVKVTE